MTKPITPQRFDSLARSTPQTRIIWTLPAIGQRVGRGRGFARALVEVPGSPIRRQGRQFYAVEHELIDWMSGRAAGESK